MSEQNAVVAVTTESVVNSQPVAPEQGGTPEATPGPADTAAGEQEPQAKPEEGDRKRDRSAEKRIRRLTKQAEDALRDAGYWRGVAEARAAGTQPEPTADGTPQPRQPNPSAQIDPANAEAAKTVIERLEESGKDIEDFDEVMETITSQDFSISRTMRDFLGESDRPAHLAQWLAQNPKEAARIARLEPAVAVRALEKAEARLPAAKAPPKKVTGAPPPVSTVGGGSTSSFDPNKAGMDDFAKWRRRQA